MLSSSSSRSPRKSPHLSSPARGVPPQGVPGRGANRGAGCSVPVGTFTPQLRRGRGRPDQAGFVQCGARGASRSSPHLTLPSFSTEEEDDDENDDDNNNDDNDDDEDTDDEEEKEVDFPNQGNIQRRRQMVQGGK